MSPDEVRALTAMQVGFVAEGCCPWCKREIRDWLIPRGPFGSQTAARLRAAAINPRTGHKANCTHGTLAIR